MPRSGASALRSRRPRPQGRTAPGRSGARVGRGSLGYRRSLKPEIGANGGRVTFNPPITAQDVVVFRGTSPVGPGIRVAAPASARETFISGTSPAAALVTRRAARLNDLIDQIAVGQALSRHQRVASIKALLIHGTQPLGGLEDADFPVEQCLGYGPLARDLTDGCGANEAVVLFAGTIGANQEQDLEFPLPDGLNIREAKRVEATLAWLSPINWRHRQYRRAALQFVKPSGPILDLGTPVGLSKDTANRGATNNSAPILAD